MTVKTSISLTDQQEAFARSLVERGHYPSLSAVLQHGLEMLRAETERRDLDMEALRAALRKRAEGEFTPLEPEGVLSARIVAEARAKYGLSD
jgi:antitoxin ParD1/3/4